MRSFLHLLIAISIFITGGPVPLALGADKQEITAVEWLEARETQMQAEKLYSAFEGLANPDYSLDIFHLLRQTVNEEDIRRVEMRIQRVQKTDPQGENVEDFIDRDVPPKRFYSPNLRFRINRGNTGMLKEIQEEKAEGVYSIQYSGDATTYMPGNSVKAGQPVTFSIFSKSGTLLHRFMVDIEAFGIYGKYLVYIERNTYNSETMTTPLRYINLDYFRGAIGNSALPVFTMPIKIGPAVNRFTIANGKLAINHKEISNIAFEALSHVYQLMFNLSVGLVDPATKIRTESLVQELILTFDQALLGHDDLMREQLEDAIGGSPEVQDLLRRLNWQTTIRTQAPVLEQHRLVLKPEEIHSPDWQDAAKRILAEKMFQETLRRTNRSLQSTQKFVSRLNMLAARLGTPRPMGSPLLIQSMAMLAEAYRHNNTEQIETAKYEITEHPAWRYVKYGSIAVAGAAIGQSLPEPYTIDLLNSFDLIARSVRHVHDYLVANGDSFLEYTKSGVTNMADSVTKFPEVWLEGGKWKNALVGVGSGLSMLFLAFATVQITVNGFRAAEYMKSRWQSVQSNGLSFVEGFKKLFVGFRSFENNKAALEFSLAQQSIVGDPEDLTDHERLESQLLLQQLEEQELHENSAGFRNSMARFFRKVGMHIGVSSTLIGRAAYVSVRLADVIEKRIESITQNRITTFTAALKDFLFSYVSTMHTVRFLGLMWTYWTPTRAFLWRPTIWYLLARYPNFFKTVVDSSPGEVHLPTEYNGGLRSRWDDTDSALARRFGSGNVENLKRFEAAVVPYEREIFSQCLQRAVVALVHHVKDPSRVLHLFSSSEIVTTGMSAREIIESSPSSSGIRDLNDPKLKRLSLKEKTYFRAYFTKLYELTMREFLRDFIGRRVNEDLPDNVPRDVLIQSVLNFMPEFDLRTQSPELAEQHAGTAKRFVSGYTLQAGSHATAHHFAIETSEKMRRFVGDLEMNTVFKGVELLDPTGRQMRLFHTAKQQLNDPRALMRAVRQQLSHLFVSVPIQLAGIMLLYNTVDYGLLQPLYPETFGENSFMHMNKYLFVEGFLLGTLQAFMSGPWTKVLRDHRLDQKKVFDKVPMQSDRESGFWRYFLKALRHPKNRWWQNQVQMTQILVANIPAALATYVVTNLIALGRVDVGLILGGYIAALLTPYIGFEQKADQAFELASSHVIAQVPKKYRALPGFQDWINRQLQAKRNRFNLIYQIGGELWQGLSNLMLYQPQPGIGSRGLMRLIFGGYEPVELFAKGIRSLADKLDFIPGVETAGRWCETVLTNNYVDWEKIPSTEEYWNKTEY